MKEIGSKYDSKYILHTSQTTMQQNPSYGEKHQ